MLRPLPMLAAFLLGAAAALCAALVINAYSRAGSSPRVTLPTAYDLRTGRSHVVDPLDCNINDVGYSGRAVCSWVRNP